MQLRYKMTHHKHTQKPCTNTHTYKHTGFNPSRLHLWRISNRKNGTVRPNRLLSLNDAEISGKSECKMGDYDSSVITHSIVSMNNLNDSNINNNNKNKNNNVNNSNIGQHTRNLNPLHRRNNNTENNDTNNINNINSNKNNDDELQGLSSPEPSPQPLTESDSYIIFFFLKICFFFCFQLSET